MNDERRVLYLVTWTAVFAANLIIPLLYGWEVTRDGGRGGMGLAILALCLFGLVVSAQSRKMAWALALGGCLVALLQPVMVLHIFAGGLALNLWTGSIRGGGLSEFGGFAVTVMTGGPLMVLALVCGLVIDWLFIGPAPGRGE